VLAVSDSFELSSLKYGALKEAITQHPAFQSLTEEKDYILVYFKDPVKAEELNESFFKNGIILSHLTERKRSLEQHFLELLDDNK